MRLQQEVALILLLFCVVVLISLPACADGSSDAPVSGTVSDSSSGTTSGDSSDTGSGTVGDTGSDIGSGTVGDTGSDTGSGTVRDTGSDTGSSGTVGDTGSDTGSGTGNTGETGGSVIVGDTGEVTGDDTSGDTVDGTGGDTGSGIGDITSGDTGGDDGTGSPVFLTTMTPVTASSSSGDPDTTGGDDDSGSLETKTLAIVTVSLPPAGSIALDPSITGAGYTFTGNYAGGTIDITATGTYHLIDDLVSNAAEGTDAAHTFAIRISAPNVVLDGNSHTVTGFYVFDYVDGISTSQSGVTIQNFGEISDFFGDDGTGSGIYSTGTSTTITNTILGSNYDGIHSEGDSAVIRNNIAFDNEYGIYSSGGSATITNNRADLSYEFGIQSEGNGALITGNTLTDNDGGGIYSTGSGTTVTGNTVGGWCGSCARGIESWGDQTVIRGNTVTTQLVGINSGGDQAEITGNIVTDNELGMWSLGNEATITSNTIRDNGDALVSDGTDADITGNTVTNNILDGILSEGDNARISDNTVTGNDGGIGSFGDAAVITDNIVTGNEIGLWVGDTVIDTTITRNSVAGSTLGVEIWNEGGGGTNNYIYDNYFANVINVRGYILDPGDPACFSWTNPAGPVPGRNVMGGPTIAGNFWSNPTGTGWSDARYDRDGYSKTEEYEVVTGSGVYDTAPLVTYPHSGPPLPFKQGQADSTPPTDLTPPIQIVINVITIPAGVSPGTATTLTLDLEQNGTATLPPQSAYVFFPVNEAASALGEFTATTTDGVFNEVELPFTVPTEPGVYTYEFQPYLVETNPLTGEEVSVPAGAPVSFTVTVGEDGSVGVVSG